MKGMVFTEFLEMVEDRFSPEVADKIIDAAELDSGGAYTSLGTYDYREMVRLVTHLGRAVDVPVPDLLRVFGEHLFTRFVKGYPRFFQEGGRTFDFLHKVDDYIHVEVRKLYADAELPRFEYSRDGEDRMEMVYTSARPFGDLAEGLIRGCIAHFSEPIDLVREDLAAGELTSVRFTLTRRDDG